MPERIPPHNEDAEKSVLGAAMLSKDALFDVLEFVKPEDFYNQMHREIFDAMVAMNLRNQPVDVLTLTEELKKRNALELAGGRSYIAGLSNSVPSTANAGDYAKIVAEKSILRKLIKSSDEVVEACYADSLPAGDILNNAEQKVFGISQSREKRDMTPLTEALKENLRQIDEAVKNKGKVHGVPSGFKDLDDKLNGFQKSDLIIIAARPAMGKTAFVLNVALQAALKGNASVAIFSLEMAKEQLSQRILSMESRVESTRMKKGEVDPDDWEKISVAMDKLQNAKILIEDTPGIGIAEIRNKCRRMKAEKGLDMVIIDYLQLMSLPGRHENRQNEIATLSRQLKLLARELDCPVLVLSQLSRGVDNRTDRHP
ncbi:MAG: replicative DNA helicase, partial [Firmicutes bacterium]|nr:replicative DNA helicase [Bacillota bacterium]